MQRSTGQTTSGAEDRRRESSNADTIVQRSHQDLRGGIRQNIRQLFAPHVDDPEEVRPALEQAMAHDGFALIDAAVNRQELAMPPSLKLDQIVDVNLYMIRAILNGRGDEVIDLARTTFFR